MDGKFIKKQYYDLLFRCLCEHELLSVERQNKWRMDFQKYFDMLEIDRDILSEIKKRYGIGLQNVFLTNCKKNILLCENFGTGRDKGLIRASVYFSGLGCLLDYLLDFGNREQKAEARRKLDWDYCKDYFLGHMPAKENSPIDLLYEKVSTGMSEIASCNPNALASIAALVRQAISAELSVGNGDAGKYGDEAVLNKSILFVMTAAEILLAGKSEGKEVYRELIRRLGYTYALIDDLCDLYEDMEIGQRNLFLKYISVFHREADMEEVIRLAVSELTEQLQIMKENFDRPLYELVLQEIREWGMSNEELRNRVWCIDG